MYQPLKSLQLKEGRSVREDVFHTIVDIMMVRAMRKSLASSFEPQSTPNTSI